MFCEAITSVLYEEVKKEAETQKCQEVSLA